MLVSTNYKGVRRQPDDIVEVNEETAKRWHTNKIAALKKSDIAVLFGEDDSEKEDGDDAVQNVGDDSQLGGVPGDTGKPVASEQRKATKKGK
jgi:hypothetical protein